MGKSRAWLVPRKEARWVMHSARKVMEPSPSDTRKMSGIKISSWGDGKMPVFPRYGA